MKIPLFKNRGGFTFLELLISITIIGIIATISMITLRTQSANARDARRRADIEQVRTALEFYRQAQHTYPNEVPTTGASGWEISTATNFLQELVNEGAMQKIPRDPRNTLVNTGAGAFFLPRPNGDFFYAYHRYEENLAAAEGSAADNAAGGSRYGCDFDGTFTVLAIKSLEGSIPRNTPRAQCGMTHPSAADGCSGGGENLNNPNTACRDWGNEFDYSIILH